jgi:hypothetical protein
MRCLSEFYFSRVLRTLLWWCSKRLKANSAPTFAKRPSIKARIRWAACRTWHSFGEDDVTIRLLGQAASQLAYIFGILIILTFVGEQSGIVGEMWPNLTWSVIGQYLKWSAAASALISALNISLKFLWNLFVDEWHRWWYAQRYGTEPVDKQFYGKM